MHGAEQFGLAELLHDALVQGRQQQLREQGRRDEHHEQPVPAAPQRDDEDRGEDDRGEALGDQEDDTRDSFGQRIEGVDQIAFEADERVGRARGEQQPEEHEEHADDQAQHVRRRAHVFVGRRFVDLGSRFRQCGRMAPRPVAVHQIGGPGDQQDEH